MDASPTRCPSCNFDNPPNTLSCNLCGHVLQREAPSTSRRDFPFDAPPPAQTPPPWKRILGHPATAMAIGLFAFPLAKILSIPNYIFNFLTTLVHEVGHSLCAWLMGMPSIPSVGIGGGGVTVWRNQEIILCVAILIAMAVATFFFLRHRKSLLAAGIGIMIVYALLAFSRHHQTFAAAGGILLELAGAGACFVVVFTVALERPWERPLYALWGWWMLLNRGYETILMITDRSYWDANTVYESGLAAGLTNDLEVLRDALNTGHTTVLWSVLLCAIAVLPLSLAAGWLFRRRTE